MNEFIAAVRFNQFDEFRARYREQCDVLLIDDIQFIAGRDRTMDEFFHVFNALYEAEKQIVVTSDRMPSRDAGHGGPPDLPAQLGSGRRRQAARPRDPRGHPAPEGRGRPHRRSPTTSPCTWRTSSAPTSASSRARSSASRPSRRSSRVPITCEFVSEMLGGPAPTAQPPPVSIESVQKAVATHFSVRIADLKGPRRHQGISRPRMIAMYLSRQLTGASFPEIGLRFGGKDHSTVINACKRIDSIPPTTASSGPPSTPCAVSSPATQRRVHSPLSSPAGAASQARTPGRHVRRPGFRRARKPTPPHPPVNGACDKAGDGGQPGVTGDNPPSSPAAHTPEFSRFPSH
jgi:chromosomal replication initiator protein